MARKKIRIADTAFIFVKVECEDHCDDDNMMIVL